MTQDYSSSGFLGLGFGGGPDMSTLSDLTMSSSAADRAEALMRYSLTREGYQEEVTRITGAQHTQAQHVQLPPPPVFLKRPDHPEPPSSSNITQGYEGFPLSSNATPTPTTLDQQQYIGNNPQGSSTTSGPPSTVDQEVKVQAGRSKALEIVQKFTQQQQQQQQQQRPDDPRNIDPSELRRKRIESLQKLEDRKRIALLKNLEYLARVEDERLQAQLQKMQDTERLERDMHNHHERILEQRKNGGATFRNGTSSSAGIGHSDRPRKRPHPSSSATTNDSSLAIYVSGLPTDGSVSQDFMRSLFGPFGTLRKIHFYVNKQTGALKGDCLVIYQVRSATGDSADQQLKCKELSDMVCSQVRREIPTLYSLFMLHYFV